MNQVTVSFNQSNEESVTATVISIYTHLDEDKLPALEKISGFQKKMVELLNDKFKKELPSNYNQFYIRMMTEKDILTVANWTEAFNHVDNAAVRDYTKASLWSQPNSNSSNSGGDRPNWDPNHRNNKKP